MNVDDFLEKLAEMLDCEGTLFMETQLDNLEEWDSLGILSFLAEMEDYTSSPIQAKDVKEAKTVSDLYELIK